MPTAYPRRWMMRQSTSFDDVVTSVLPPDGKPCFSIETACLRHCAAPWVSADDRSAEAGKPRVLREERFHFTSHRPLSFSLVNIPILICLIHRPMQATMSDQSTSPTIGAGRPTQAYLTAFGPFRHGVPMWPKSKARSLPDPLPKPKPRLLHAPNRPRRPAVQPVQP